ncbi:anhydro-N-acetylmuramic acid kinase [Tropicimonas sp. S265A]|uniref:anhydro-N-acetylmuramic acid kinase n=1 Tax=Tropicimonas sp. S265A TaxID=3415134 RepID=UPI003C7CD1B7
MKGKRLWALGAMSGTSLDGVDAAMVLTDGRAVFETGAQGYRPYTDPERAVLRSALGVWDGPEPGAAAPVVLEAHVALLSGFERAEIVGFHGQTLAHDPGGRGTLQVGDGARLAERLGLPVIWDFRSADVGMGGQGAPLAPFYHHAIARHAGLTAPVAFVNLGGVGNLTWVDPTKEDPADTGAVLAFDTGPANAPINDLMRARRGQDHDRDGLLAADGRVDQDIVSAFLERPWFYKLPPKSLDRNDFHDLLDKVSGLNDPDAAATLTACAAAAVAAGLALCEIKPERVFLCGGGRKNPVLKEMITLYAGAPVEDVETLGFDGDMIEAQAFGYLAVRVLNGLPTSVPGTTGVRAAVGGGVVSQP